jgi:hypothetical protein
MCPRVPGEVRWIVSQANGVSKRSICGIDTTIIARELLDPMTCDLEKDEIRRVRNIHKKRKVTVMNKNGGGLWDADHIIPVQYGGGECGLDNIRTLCISCHKIITFSKP